MIVAAARGARRELVAPPASTDESTRSSSSRPTSSRSGPAGRPTAVAGYPWFGEWSRDLMTSYEGLYLATSRHDEGREVLRTSAATVSEGMLANTADTGSLEYNTVDGTLWFVHAARPPRRRHRRRRPRPRARTGRSSGSSTTTSRARGTGSASTPPTGCCARAPKGWALTWMDAASTACR